MTSLLPVEFDELLLHFAPHWERSYRCRTLEGKVRLQPAHRERANVTLSGTEIKLLFLLFCLKTNLLQQQ